MLLQEGFPYTGLLLLGIIDPPIYEKTMLSSFLKHKNPKTQKSCWPKINNVYKFQVSPRHYSIENEHAENKSSVHVKWETNDNNQGV
jgi:hypothetical protein